MILFYKLLYISGVKFKIVHRNFWMLTGEFVTLRAMNTDVEHLNLKENMLMNRTRCLILISLLVGMFAQAQTSSIK
ncbi:hypothetical protein DW080_21885, partial [Bacteroides caccae]